MQQTDLRSRAARATERALGSYNAITFLALVFLLLTIGAVAAGLIQSGDQGTTYLLSAAPLAAVFGIFVVMARNVSDEERRHLESQLDRSKFYLESFLKGADEGVRMLEGGPIERVRWIAAARVIGFAQRIEAKITEPEHKDVLEIYKTQLRNRLFAIFDSLDARDLFGVEYEKMEPLVRVANRSAGSDKAPPYVSHRSLLAMLRFSRYPDGYQDHDPLSQEESLFKSDWESLCTFYPEIRRYLEFHEGHIYVMGRFQEVSAETEKP